MLVKCSSCGSAVEKLPTNDVPEYGYHRYYCSKCIDEALSKQDVKRLCDSIFGYHVINTQLENGLKEISKLYTYSTICKYITTNQDELTLALSRTFNSERHKINYFIAIIKNHIADFAGDQDNEMKMNVAFEFYEPKYVPHKRKRSIAEFEGDMN